MRGLAGEGGGRADEDAPQPRVGAATDADGAASPPPVTPAVPAFVADSSSEPRGRAATARPAADVGPTAADGGPTPEPPPVSAATGIARLLSPPRRALSSRRALRLRTAVAAFLVVASALGVLVSALALWSRDVVFDTDTYVRTIAPAADDPQVRRAIGSFAAAEAVDAADLERRIASELPSGVKPLAPALTRSLQAYLTDEIVKFLGTPLARRLWADSNRVAHEQLITALRGRNPSVTVGHDDVKLDLLPLVAVAVQRLQSKVPQLLGRDVALPAIDPSIAPGEFRTLLQDALRRRLPPDFGTITLLRGDQGYEAGRALGAFDDLVTLVVVITAALILAALLVSVRRRRTAVWLGLGSLLAFAIARVVEARLEKAIAGSIASQDGAAVARSIVDSAIHSLDSFLIWIAVAGLVITVTAFLAGRPAWLNAAGRGFAKLFGVASDLSTPDTGAARWMSSHLDLLRVLGAGGAVVVLLLVTGSLTAVLVVFAALIVYEVALSVFAVGVPKEPDEGKAGDPETPAT